MQFTGALRLCFLVATSAVAGFEAQADILVPANSAWRYWKGIAEPSTPTNAWREIDFDDSAWLVGQTPFHYGSNPTCAGADDVFIGGVTTCVPDGTILDDMRGNYTCVFMRQTFVLPDTSAVVTLTLKLALDDGIAVWINGRPARPPVGVNGFAYTNTALQPREATGFTRQDISVTNLVDGTNVICVQAFNAGLSNDDFHVNLELTSSELRPFPLSANQRGLVTCLETPAISYDVYLPPAYSIEGNPLPILYTFNPDGGGMVSNFRSVCSNLNMIVIGVTGPRNSQPWDTHIREYCAVTRDVRQRLLFDPTAEFAGGFSGGGQSAYVFSRFRAQHVAGIFGMAGWLGRTLGYYSTDRVQTNLLVARATGTTDAAGNHYILPDSNYLASAGAVIQDWFFPGGHTVAPDVVKSNGLSWLLSQRLTAGPDDRSNSIVRAIDWRQRLAKVEDEAVLRECIAVLLTKPRTWDAYHAQLILDRIATNYARFRSIELIDLAEGDFASDLFYYYARGAALAGDFPRYYFALKVLTAVRGTDNNDRVGDLRALLLQFGYPAPVLHWSADRIIGRLNVRILRDTPRLDYLLQLWTGLHESPWQDISAPTHGSNSYWAAEIDFQPGSKGRFFRVHTVPLPGDSPPWP